VILFKIVVFVVVFVCLFVTIIMHTISPHHVQLMAVAVVIVW